MEAKTCSTCGCETSKYEIIHSAVICEVCEEAMVLVDKKVIVSDGKNFWVSCTQCGNPAPFRPSPKEALLIAKEEMSIIDSNRWSEPLQTFIKEIQAVCSKCMKEECPDSD